MAINTNPSSRRALLAAAAGGTVALVAESLARPLPVRAGSDGDVVLGGVNDSTLTTTLRNTTGPASVLAVESNQGPAIDAASGPSHAIRAVSDTGIAISAVSKQFIGIIGWGGEPPDGGGNGTTGVMGVSGAGYGVAGMCKTGEGVHAESENGTGVYAKSTTGFGLDAASDSGTAVGAGSKKTGVHGITEGTFDFEANRDVVGVLGTSRSVNGVGGNGIGVEGRSDTGIGVLGGGQVGVHGATGFPGGNRRGGEERDRPRAPRHRGLSGPGRSCDRRRGSGRVLERGSGDHRPRGHEGESRVAGRAERRGLEDPRDAPGEPGRPDGVVAQPCRDPRVAPGVHRRPHRACSTEGAVRVLRHQLTFVDRTNGRPGLRRRAIVPSARRRTRRRVTPGTQGVDGSRMGHRWAGAEPWHVGPLLGTAAS